MADLNDFQDIEARLRKYQPAEPSAEVRATVLGRATQLPGMIPRRRLWRWVAAAVLLIAFNVGTEHYVSARLDIGRADRPKPAVAANGLELLRSLNGGATHWRALAMHSYGPARDSGRWLSERRALLKEFR